VTCFEPWYFQLARCYTDIHYNFGHHVSSTGEGAHSELKSYLNTSTGSLLHIAEAIELWVNSKKHQYDEKVGYATMRVSYEHNIPLLKNLIHRVSPYALNLILKQLALLNKEDFNIVYLKRFLKSYGLPCAHQLQIVLSDKDSPYIEFKQIHEHW
jgi:hypothetical protein